MYTHEEQKEGTLDGGTCYLQIAGGERVKWENPKEEDLTASLLTEAPTMYYCDKIKKKNNTSESSPTSTVESHWIYNEKVIS